MPCAGAGSRPLGGQATRGTLGARAPVPGLPRRRLRERSPGPPAAAAKRDKTTTFYVVTYIDKRIDQLRGESTAAKGETTAAILQLSERLSQQNAQLAERLSQQNAQLAEKLDNKIDKLRVETTAARGETTAAILQLSERLSQQVAQLAVRQGGLESSVDASRTTTVSLFGVVGVIVALLMYFRPS